MILDIHGRAIWASTNSYGQVYNLQVQEFKGNQYLTFWAGNDAVGGHGVGEYYMLDQHYNEQFRIKAANGLGADLHAFTITKDNTALISIYQAIAVDISGKAKARTSGWIWDSVFQEIDIETGEALFQWRASTHIPITKSYTDMNDAVEDDPWDVYHINSVEKDGLGNYLVSIRFLRALIYIECESGNVLWQLGDRDNSFHDLSKGEATTFVGQHDAHWYDGHNYITLFDNRADWYHQASDQSRGVRVAIDLDNMTAKLDQTFTDPFNKILSTSQGSVQTLPNGNVLLGYGFNGVVAEFASNGELLCDMYMQPASTFTSGDVQSYRNLKFNWTGLPDTKPSLLLEDSKLYMSWNGATEIATWLLVGSDEDENLKHTEEAKNHDEPRGIDGALVVVKTGFETVYDVLKSSRLRQYVCVIAIDRNGTPLGTSNIVDIGGLAMPQDEAAAAEAEDADAPADYEDDTTDLATQEDLEKDVEDLQIIVFLGALALMSAMFIACLTLGKDRLLQPFSRAVYMAVPNEEKLTPKVGNSHSWPLRVKRALKSALFRWRGRDGATEVAAQQGLLANDNQTRAEEGHSHYPEVQEIHSSTTGVV